MAKKEAKHIDPTKISPATYRQLQEANSSQFTGLSPEYQKYTEDLNNATTPRSMYDANYAADQLVSSSLSNTSTPWGESFFDNENATEDEWQNLGDVRAENQPWYSKIANGITKGVVLAGTTFLDGTIGLLYGAGTAIARGFDDKYTASGAVAGLWDNDFSKAMQAINEGSEEWIPNYYTQKELNSPWYENIFTANFLGDKFIKNLGFTVGAFYSGGVAAAGLKGAGRLAFASAKRMGATINTLKNTVKVSDIAAKGVGAVTSAVNEGRIEALNNSKDWFEGHKMQLDDSLATQLQALQAEYEANKGQHLVQAQDGSWVDPAYEQYKQKAAKAQEDYNLALGRLSEDRYKMGNLDLALNIPILTASNLIQFAKLYGNGFKTARKTLNVVERKGKYAAGSTKWNAAYHITKGALAEGTEEISQKAVSTISGLGYEQDVNNFYKAKRDDKGEQETIDWMKATAQGINETVGDGSSWEEFFIGTLTGALGMPRFRSAKNAEGKWRSPITIEGGAFNEWKEFAEKREEETKVADYMNKRLADPNFLNYYRGLNRHNKYQNDMGNAALRNDEFDFKNAEHAQMVSDIIMFDKAGKLEDLKQAISQTSTSKEDLESIVTNTTKKAEDGTLQGPFAQYASTDEEGNIVANLDNEDSQKAMREKLESNSKSILGTIDNYQKNKDEILTNYNSGQLTDEQIEELTWMKSQLKNWEDRASSMSKEIKSALRNVAGSIESMILVNQQIRDYEGQAHADLSNTYRKADENIKELRESLKNFDIIKGLNDKEAALTLAINPEFSEALIKGIDNLDDSVMSAEEKESAINKLNDIIKLGKASEIYKAKLKEYLKNPQKQAEDHARADEEAVQQENKKKSDNLKSSLRAAKNMQEFRAAVDSQEDAESTNATLKAMEAEGNEMAKNYRETTQYYNELSRILNESDADPQVKQDALKLLQDHFNNAENLEQLSNSNSVYINNENAFDEDSEGDVELSADRFTKAQYEVQKAMSKINKDNKFKDRFSEESRNPVDRMENIERVDNPDGTIDFHSLKNGKRVSTYGGMLTDLTEQEKNDNGLLGSESDGIIDDIRITKFRGRNSQGEYVYDINYRGKREDGSTFREKASIKVNRNLHEAKGDDRTSTGSDATSTTPPVGTSERESVEIAVGDITSEQVAEENKNINAQAESQQQPKGENKKYYRPAIPELHIEASKDGDFRAFDVVVREKEGADFSAIYNYLRDKGAFEYLNSGKLKVGDDIGFMIDPEFEKKVEGQEWHKAPTIFLINKKDGQVVGSLDEGSSITNFEGLAGLEEKVRNEYAQSSSQPQQRQFKTDYQYDKEMSFYGGQVHGTLDRVENGTAIYVDDKGQPTILLAGKSDHQFIGIFREPNSNRWSIKMENKEGDKSIFRDMMSSVMSQLPQGAEIYERTSISVDGLRVFAQQLNHGFEIGNETYETDINGGDIANIFGLSKADQEAMEKVHISEQELPKVKEILKPYLEKFGVKNIDKVVYLTNGNTLSVKLPILVKTKQSVNNSTNNQVADISKVELNKNEPKENDKKYTVYLENGNSNAHIFGSIRQGISDHRDYSRPGARDSQGNKRIEHLQGTDIYDIRGVSSIVCSSSKLGRNRGQNGFTITTWRRLTANEKNRIKEYFEGAEFDAVLKKGGREWYKLVLKKIDDIMHQEDSSEPINSGNPINDKPNLPNKPFIATPTTKVSKVMVGKVPYSESDRNLKDVPNVSSESHKPIFGIIKNGVMTTNGAVSSDAILNPMNGGSEGRLYLLVPNGAGKYSPVAVRVKHFNKEEFNLHDAAAGSTAMGENIKEAITKLANATSQEDVSKAAQELSAELYMQDIMINYFSSAVGDGITISRKLRNTDGSYTKTTIKGKEQIKEEKHSVYFTKNKKNIEYNGLNIDAEAAAELGLSNELGTPKDPQLVFEEILGHLMGFNLPLQVSARSINNGNYNVKLINSGILMSNLTEATTKGTWFTTDYFDKNGKLQKATNPASVIPQPARKAESPVKGTEGAISGTRIVSTFSGKTYYVDLKTNTIRDEQGKEVKVTKDNNILFDLAWAQSNYGDAKNSSVMVDNKIVTPSGRVLDRTKQKYITGKKAQKIKDTINGKGKKSSTKATQSEKVISSIYENQKKVDKERTDDEHYWILEDDGEYHPYDRVHKRLGSNWTASDKQTTALKSIQTRLSKLISSSLTSYNNYLDTLSKKYDIDLSAYYNKTGIKDRSAVVTIIRDKMSGTNSKRALDAGTSVDSVIRQFFTIEDVSKITKPSNMSDKAFVDLLARLNEIKTNIQQSGERFLTDNIVLYQKYPDGTRVAGEVDILAVDKNGNFKIYDVKTSRYSFYEFKDRYGHKVNYFTNPSGTQRISTKDYYTLQLSAYKNLFESQYGVPVTDLAIMPFVLGYSKDQVTSIQGERGIPITYNPAVAVPLVGSVKTESVSQESTQNTQKEQTTQYVYPMFNTSLDVQNPIEDLTPHHSMNNADEGIGYFEIDGKLHKGYITPLTAINGTEVFITKVPALTKGFGNTEEHVAYNDYYAVFPNGRTFLFVKGNPVEGGKTQEQIKEVIKKGLEGNPQRVESLASEKTILYNPEESVTGNDVDEVSTDNKQTNSQANAAATIQKEQAINEHDDEFEDDDLKLRDTASSDNAPIWDREKEIAWLDKVLPQLSREQRVKVVEGLIKVGNKGTTAWGMFDGNIMTLSDIAAEGTTYHEAFHVVFNLLMDESEKEGLLKEYRLKHPHKSNLELEEEMAEDYREFVMNGGKDTRSLGRKIIDFFKSLFIKSKYWKQFRPSSMYYFRAITNGKYASKNLSKSSISRTGEEEYTQEMKDILAKASRDAEGNLLAPNGEVSNLTERQYAQVRTKAFKNWFGDWENNPKEASKVVDENGEPLVVYHGGENNISSFITYHQDSEIGDMYGAYFTKDKKYAKSYNKGTLYEVFLNIREPLTIEGSWTGIINKDQVTDITAKHDGIVNDKFDNGILYKLHLAKTRTEIIVFNPNQIKSATDNVGTFSTTNDDIRYRTTDSSRERMFKQEAQRFLNNFGITIKEYEEYDNSEIPLFDAVNRVINIRNANDLSEGMGYAIAFMMQHNKKIEELITLHKRGQDSIALKGVRRSIKKRGDFDTELTKLERRNLNKQEALKEIGKDIAYELRKLYKLETIKVNNSYISNIWEGIKAFFEMMTPRFRTTLSIISNNLSSVANAVKLNDASIIRNSDFKPDTTVKAERVILDKALQENPYEDNIIRTLQNYGIALAGSASIAIEGRLMRPAENPLHDIDFNAKGHTKESLDEMLEKEFQHFKHTNHIENKDRGKITETYLILDREFTVEKPEDSPVYIIRDTEGRFLGNFKNSELALNDGVKGKFLDFFTGKSTYGNHIKSINGRDYLISDARNAFEAKVDWARDKDIWDYNNFVTNDQLDKLANEVSERNKALKEKVANAKVIWGHPALGKTTYLERNDDILEWDDLVNNKRNAFFREQIDPNHTMDPNSIEYKHLRSVYMATWKQHPEYVDFLTREWNNLIERARRENKRVFASPLPLLEIGRNDIDLIVALDDKTFRERDLGRGNTEVSNRGWKQNIDKELVNQDPSKVFYTSDYMSDFMRKYVGVNWGTLTDEEAKSLQLKGWTKEQFESVSQEERDQAVKCIAF